MDTQHERILKYLKHHRQITPMDAFNELGITKLSTRISELIGMGYPIKKDWGEGLDRYGDKVRFMTYRLEKKC